MPSFHAPVQLRWVDLDAQRHVNNSMIVDYLQEARTQFLLTGPTAEMLNEGCIVVSHRVEFLSQLPFSYDVLDVELVVSELGGSRFEISYVVRALQTEIARARTVLCPFDFASNAPRRLTQGERGFLASYRRDLDPMSPLVGTGLDGRGVGYDIWARWSDLDRYGHVNNVRFFDYIQESRISVMVHADPTMARLGTPQWDQDDERVGQYTWLLARQDLNYLSQINYRREPYRVNTAPTRIGSSSITLTGEIIDPVNDDAVLARARTVLVCGDANGKPTALPDQVRGAMAALLVQ